MEEVPSKFCHTEESVNQFSPLKMTGQLIFTDKPSVELLQWLARGSLKQNLQRAVRLWVILRFLYGDEKDRLCLSESFTYSDWRDKFFTETHPRGDEIPILHDPYCRCALTIADWLFDRAMGLPDSQLRQKLLAHASAPQNLDVLLQQRLFGVTRRSLAKDLEILVQLGWLTYNYHRYQKVKSLPSRSQASQNTLAATSLSVEELNFLHPDLAAIANNFSRPINGIQRFFLHTDYVVPRATLDQIDDRIDQLQHIWQQKPISCVLIVYNSAKLKRVVECVVYPVCIYYVQRATYLVAFGRNPSGEVNWYNYRLDRIQELIPLEWIDRRIPQRLIYDYQAACLPTPEYIQEQLGLAWGFDFYQPAAVMLLRFDRNHHDRYIQDTERHDTFKRVTYQQATRLINKYAPAQQQKTLKEILQKRCSEDAYYQVVTRLDDPNIKQRLFAWRPFVEVLLPWELRQAITTDVFQEWQIYQQNKSRG